MTFNTAAFALFFPIVLLGAFLVPRRVQNLWLLAASGFFYLYNAPRFGIYFLCTIALTYAAGLVIGRLQGKKSGKAALALALLLLLGALGVLKYYDFFTGALQSALAAIGVLWQPASLGIAEPLGISFYTFTAAGYLIDLGRGKVKAEKNPIDLALFLSFFPQQLSGPIARADSLLPQLKTPRRFNKADFAAGAQRFVYGLMKKAVVADWLMAFNDAVLYRLGDQNPLCILSAILLYSMQLYFDFSGYCDMALGCARMLGLRLCENFRAPYFATSFSELWSRWHISLTSWLRDYLYIPLGGSRRGFGRKLLNILIVFTVSGLWHGAAWGYVVWGILHAVLRIAQELLGKLRRGREKKGSAATDWAKRAGLYILWSLSFVFFRLVSVSDALYAIRRCFDLGEYSLYALAARGMSILRANIPSSDLYILCVAAVVGAAMLFVLILEYRKIYRAKKEEPDAGYVLRDFGPNARFAATMLMIAAILFCGRFGVSSFVYFQF